MPSPLSSAELLAQTGHRPWPLPARPWLMCQTWEDLCFLHWPVAPGLVAPFIPPGLSLDTYDGQAWISVVPFQMDYRLRLCPWTIRFQELNVRTYVIGNGKAGVFFFSLDASDAFTVLAARLSYALPYHLAQINLDIQGEKHRFHSQRSRLSEQIFGTCQPLPPRQDIFKDLPCAFEAEYQPISPVYYASKNTMEHWLTERYCLFTVKRDGHIYQGDVHHLPWPLQTLKAEIQTNTLLRPWGIDLSSPPAALHYAQRLDVLLWKPRKLNPSPENR